MSRQSIQSSPEKLFASLAGVSFPVFLAAALLVAALVPAHAAMPPMVHLSDPGDWLISRHGAKSIAVAAGTEDQALLVVTGGALLSAGAPTGREQEYSVAMLDAAGISVANLAHRDLAGDADSLGKALRGGEVRFVSASFRIKNQPWQPFQLIQAGGVSVAFIGVAGLSPSMELPDSKTLPDLEYIEPFEAVRLALEQAGTADYTVLLADLPLSEAMELGSRFPGLTAVLNSGRGGIQFDNVEYGGVGLSPPGGLRAAVHEEGKAPRVIDLPEPARVNPRHGEVQRQFDFEFVSLGAFPGRVFEPVPPPDRVLPGETSVLNIMRENRAARWSIHSMAVLDFLGANAAPEGHRWLAFDVEWENLLTPRVVRERELPVAYSVRELADHLYLVKEGKRLLPLQAPGNVPNLLEGASSINLPRIGSTLRGLLVYALPMDSNPENLQFRYYDFAHGHMEAVVLGALKTESAEEKTREAMALYSNEIVTMGLYGTRVTRSIKGREAPEGMTFVEMELRARSMFMFEADAGAFVLEASPGETIQVGTVSDWLEAHKYSHLVVDGEYAYTPDAGFTDLPPDPRFLPDLMTGGTMVFMVPEGFQSLVLRADFPNARMPNGEVIRPSPIVLTVWGDPAEPPEREALWEVTDDTLNVSITDQQRAGGFGGRKAETGKVFLVLDVTVRNHGDRPEFFQTAEQLRHIDSGGRQAPPHPATYEGPYRPVEHVWLPNGEQRTFEVAYLVDAGQERTNLAYRGFTLARNIALSHDPTDIAVAVSTPMEADPVVMPALASITENNRPAASGETEAPVDEGLYPAASREQALERIALTPLEIPDVDFDAPSVPALSGTDHDSMEDAMPLEEPWSVRGTLERQQRHYFRIEIQGEPQLWYVESSQATLEYRDPGGRTQLQRSVHSSTGKAVMTGLLLLPGEHWFSVHSVPTRDYTFRAFPMGPSDPHSEIEPNDDVTSAQRLDFGFHRVGRLYEPGDRDAYRFSTSADENVRITLEAPSDMTLRMELMEVFGGSKTRRIQSEGGGDIEFTTRLPESDYLISIFGRPSDQRSDHPYVLRLERLNPFDSSLARAEDDPTGPGLPADIDLPVSLSLEDSTAPLAAFRPDAQRVNLPMGIVNHGDSPLTVHLDSHVSDQDTTISFTEPSLTIPEGGKASGTVTALLPPDLRSGYPVVITIRARGEDGGQVTAQTHLMPRCAVKPQAPEPYQPLPGALMGGLNVAWTALGADVPADERERNQILTIFDGFTPFDGGYNRPPRFPREFTVKLAGDAPVPVTGFTLHPQAGRDNPNHQTKSFDVLVSMDGETFQEVLSGELDRRASEQAFMFEAPVMARYARLRINSNHIGTTGRMMLGQWKVIAQPGNHIPGQPALNIASHELGAHVVWMDPFPSSYTGLLNMLSEGGRPEGLNLRHPRPIHWVVSFFQQRAARITELQWVDAESRRHEALQEVVVSVSMESPLGPWTELGAWKLERTAGGIARFVLPEPLWARYVLFTSYDPDKPNTSWQLPQTLRILERMPDENYRSVVAEWGHYNRNAVYERLEQPEPEPFIPLSGTHATAGDARPLPAGTAVSGAVQVGESEDWYLIEVPEGADRLTLNLSGRPNLRVLVRMIDDEGESVPLQRDDISPRERVMRTEVSQGATYRLRVYEPPRSIVFAWDNSASMGPYKSAVRQGLREFVEQVAPGLEYANFLPFQDGSPELLHPEWTDQAHRLWTTLTNYHGRDESSSAEPNLLTATRELADQEGARAVLLFTDAETFGYGHSGELWQAMAKTPPQIFSVELHTRRNQPYQQNLMQSWASVNSGYYSLFISQQDIDGAFSRASCLLRRPALYTLTAVMDKEEAPEEPIEERKEKDKPELLDTLVSEGRVTAHGIFFDVDSHTIRSQSYTVLRQIGLMLQENPDLHLLIEGHTDITGRASRNQVLSERRADSVRGFLIDNYDIAPDRLESVGYGQERPADTNETAQGRQNNRRVELVRIEP